MRLIVSRAVAAFTVSILVALPPAEAQQTGWVHRIAIVAASGPVAEMTEARDSFLRDFFPELRRLGYTEGQNLVVERWSAAGRRESYPDVAREVVRSKPHVIFARTGRVAQALRAETTTIPIVTTTSDPVELGLATSLARPGGNVTGFSFNVGLEILGKRLDLLKEVVPRASRIAYLAPRAVWEGAWGRFMRESGARSGVTILGAPLGDPIQESEYRRVFAAMLPERPDALIVSDHGESFPHARVIVELAAQARLPAMYSYRMFVEAGGLMTYAADSAETPRRLAGYIDRILKGTNPQELPFQQPTKFGLVVNLKTAKTLNLTISPSLLLRADEVIE